MQTATNMATVNSSFYGNIWQLRTAKGEALWSWITWAFTAYWILFVAGAFLNHKALNAVGGVIVLSILAWLLLERLWVRLDAVVMASLASAVCLPVVQIMASSAPAAGALFKHISLCLVMAAARVLDLPAAFKSKMRLPLALHVLAILFISLTIYKGTSWDGGTRHSGLFVNPNNLALIPFLLLFFVDEQRDKWYVKLGAHAIVIAVLAFSATSGAVLAYAIGLAIHLSRLVSKSSRSLVLMLVAVVGIGGVVFLAAGGEKLLPETRLTNQISVIGGQLQNVLAGGDVAYYQQERVLGSGSASGIWRVAHWRRTFTTYLDGNPGQLLVGFGLGSSPLIMGKLPHNEYLRMLFEQGLVGFGLFLFAWYRIIKTAPTAVRYIGIIVAIYSFSENNLDNFPFMALFILCLSARGVGETVVAKVKQPLAALFQPAAQQA
jgi:hypothetical protein